MGGAPLTVMARSPSPRTRRPRHPWWFHTPAAIVAIVGLTYLTLGAAWESEHTVETWLAGLAVLVQAAVLLGRRRYPAAALLACAALDTAVILATAGEISAGLLGVAVAAYTVVREVSTQKSTRMLVAAAASTFVASAVSLAVNPEFTLLTALGATVLRVLFQYGLPAVLADASKSRAQLIRAYRDRADAAERDREATVQRALDEERTALARELHDIAAHHVTAIVVSIQAARVLTRTGKSDAAEPYLHTAVDEARSTLDQLRATVGLLRDHDGNDTSTHTPADIADLVAAVRNRGVTVDYRHEENGITLGPIERATVYRMIQESLANAVRHAPGADCTVDITEDAAQRAVVVTVSNDSASDPAIERSPTGGLGLIGMHERAHLIGAVLETGATGRGGWKNRLVIAPGRAS